MKKSKSSEEYYWLWWLIGVAIVAAVIVTVNWDSLGTLTHGRGSVENRCEDVTSYDYNWDNDMRCTRSDGTVFYTDYAGARAFETGR